MIILKTDKFIQLTLSNGQTNRIEVKSPLYKQVVQLIKKKVQDEKQYEPYMSIKHHVMKSSNFIIKGSQVYYNDVMLPDFMATRITQFYEQTIDISYLEQFWLRLQKNSITRNVEFLYKFLEKNGHVITHDGCFLAYKAVQSDFTDKHTGTIYNNPNTWVYMPKEEVNDNPDEGCSTGLHVGNFEYVKNFGTGSDKKILVRVAPEDVISVPSDCRHQKMRCCKYFVVREFTQDIPLEQVFMKVKTTKQNKG